MNAKFAGSNLNHMTKEAVILIANDDAGHIGLRPGNTPYKQPATENRNMEPPHVGCYGYFEAHAR
jgi:hypothetical protein